MWSEEGTPAALASECAADAYRPPPRHWCGVCHLHYLAPLDDDRSPPPSPPPAPPSDLIPASVLRRLDAFFASGETQVLHLDHLIKKLDAPQLRLVLERAMRAEPSVQVAFLQGALPLQGALFPLLLKWIELGHLWALNLGELNFSAPQMGALERSLSASSVSHLFYECAVAGEWKDDLKRAIRANRDKHAGWRLSRDHEQNHVILEVVKCWFNPTSHLVNKLFVERNRHGWPADAARAQCERCRAWRQLPAGAGWPHEFECADAAAWDAQACCEPDDLDAEPPPARGRRGLGAGARASHRVVVANVGPGQWSLGVVLGAPTAQQWARVEKARAARAHALRALDDGAPAGREPPTGAPAAAQPSRPAARAFPPWLPQAMAVELARYAQPPRSERDDWLVVATPRSATHPRAWLGAHAGRVRACGGADGARADGGGVQAEGAAERDDGGGCALAPSAAYALPALPSPAGGPPAAACWVSLREWPQLRAELSARALAQLDAREAAAAPAADGAAAALPSSPLLLRAGDVVACLLPPSAAAAAAPGAACADEADADGDAGGDASGGGPDAQLAVWVVATLVAVEPLSAPQPAEAPSLARCASVSSVERCGAAGAAPAAPAAEPQPHQHSRHQRSPQSQHTGAAPSAEATPAEPPALAATAPEAAAAGAPAASQLAATAGASAGGAPAAAASEPASPLPPPRAPTPVRGVCCTAEVLGGPGGGSGQRVRLRLSVSNLISQWSPLELAGWPAAAGGGAASPGAAAAAAGPTGPRAAAGAAIPAASGAVRLFLSREQQAQLSALKPHPLRPVNTAPATRLPAGGAGAGKGGGGRAPASALKPRAGHASKRAQAAGGSAERLCAAKRPSADELVYTPSGLPVGGCLKALPTSKRRYATPQAATSLGGAADEWQAAADAEQEQRSGGRRGGGLSERQQLQAALQMSHFCS